MHCGLIWLRLLLLRLHLMNSARGLRRRILAMSKLLLLLLLLHRWLLLLAVGRLLLLLLGGGLVSMHLGLGMHLLGGWGSWLLLVLLPLYIRLHLVRGIDTWGGGPWDHLTIELHSLLGGCRVLLRWWMLLWRMLRLALLVGVSWYLHHGRLILLRGLCRCPGEWCRRSRGD